MKPRPVDSDATPLAERKFLSIPQLTEYLDFPSRAAAIQWLYRQQRAGRIRSCHRGRNVLVLRVEVDRAVEPQKLAAASRYLQAVK